MDWVVEKESDIRVGTLEAGKLILIYKETEIAEIEFGEKDQKELEKLNTKELECFRDLENVNLEWRSQKQALSIQFSKGKYLIDFVKRIQHELKLSKNIH